ncbi:hypothetical protein Droror1_Dr00027016 [Drosera rotundifolia]
MVTDWAWAGTRWATGIGPVKHTGPDETKEQRPGPFNKFCPVKEGSGLAKDAIDSGRLTFDIGKMKVDEDPFPKAANVNMVVITLLPEEAQDNPRPEGQLVAEEEMQPVRKEDEERPGVFSHISDLMGRLCICCERDIAMVRQIHEQHARKNGGPSGEAQESSLRPFPLGPIGGRKFRPRVGCAG